MKIQIIQQDNQTKNPDGTVEGRKWLIEMSDQEYRTVCIAVLGCIFNPQKQQSFRLGHIVDTMMHDSFGVNVFFDELEKQDNNFCKDISQMRALFHARNEAIK